MSIDEIQGFCLTVTFDKEDIYNKYQMLLLFLERKTIKYQHFHYNIFAVDDDIDVD